MYSEFFKKSCLFNLATLGCGLAQGPTQRPTPPSLCYSLSAKADQTLSERAQWTAVCQHMQSEAVYSPRSVGPAQTRVA